jgi:methylmalonyl-CoA mutase cobalamin-binding domain/chain
MPRELWGRIIGGGRDAVVDQHPVARLSPVVRCDSNEQRLARLVRTIEGEIIPRLVLARRGAQEHRTVAAVQSPGEVAVTAAAGALDPEDVAQFARLLLEQDVVFATSYVESLRAQGAPLERVFLELLAPAARHLGDLWSADLVDFTEVTVGLCRLHEVLRELSPAFAHEAEVADPGRRVLLATAQGEQHTFGLFMVSEFFRRAGWEVRCAPPSSAEELVGIVHRSWFAVVGLSVSCEARLEAVAAVVRSLRKSSLNRDVGVMVGGPIFAEHPEFVARVGADATAIDGRQAPVQAENLLSLLARPC